MSFRQEAIYVEVQGVPEIIEPVDPAWRSAGGLISRTTFNTPLFQAVLDLCDRLAIRQGLLAYEPGVETDPLGDEWLPAASAAAVKGVSLPGLHKAIARGDVLARPSRDGGTRMVVSRRSLDRWTPSPTRQSAGRAESFKG